MSTVSKVLIGLASLAFLLALSVSLFGPFFSVSKAMPYRHLLVAVGAEAFSRASNNLALIAIALLVCTKRDSKTT